MAQESLITETSYLREFLLILFVLLSESYWNERRDFYFAYKNNQSRSVKLQYAKKYAQADIIFRVLNIGLLLLIFSFIYQIFANISMGNVAVQIINDISDMILLLILLFLMFFLFPIIFGKYRVSYPHPAEVVTHLRLDNNGPLPRCCKPYIYWRFKRWRQN